MDLEAKFGDTLRVPIKCETKRNEINENETKRNQQKRNGTKRNQRNENEIKRNQRNTMLDYFPYMSQCLSPGEDRI